MSPRVSVIIPIYNEVESIEALVQKLLGFLSIVHDDAEIIFIDDGSCDDSFRLLKEQTAKNPQFKLIRFMRNFGQTAALSAGFAAASGEIVVPLDADLQNDPADIPALVSWIDQGCDVVSGWRRHRRDAFVTRILPSKIANWLISKITKVPLHDYGCTLKAYRRSLLQDLHLYGEMHRFLPAYVVWSGAKLKEVEVTHHPRLYGKSKYGIMRTFKVVLDLIVVRFLTNYLAKPIHFFGGAGCISLLAGGFFGALAMYDKYFLGISFVETPLPLLTVFLILVGIQFVLMGLLAEMLMRTYFESQDRTPYIIRETVNIAS